jgi:hypothetical protein
MKKVSKTTKVAALLAKGESVQEIVKAVDCNKALVYMVRKAHFPEMGRKYKSRKKTKTENVKLTHLDAAFEAVRKGAKALSNKLLEDEAVNHPAHYTVGGIEVYDFIKAKGLSYELGNVVKYVSRAEFKANKVEDLRKARWYLDAAIKQEEAV